LHPVAKIPFVVFLYRDDYVLVVVEGIVFWVFFCLWKPNPAANIVVQFVRTDVEQASLLNRPLEGLLVVKIGAFVSTVPRGPSPEESRLITRPWSWMGSGRYSSQ
jgi:hypothetical protein